MKKLRSLLVVATLLMVLSFIIPVGQVKTNPNEGLTISSNGPPVDTIGLC